MLKSYMGKAGSKCTNIRTYQTCITSAPAIVLLPTYFKSSVPPLTIKTISELNIERRIYHNNNY